MIACEDTRHSGLLLKKLDINTKLVSFHKNNQKSRIPTLIKYLEREESLALISDAGLPGISDPGESLVNATLSIGHEVICIPGPCAATTALITSGLPCQRFCFEGFLPSTGKDRKLRLQEIVNETRTTVIYESPHRLLKLLEELSKLCDINRPLKVSRELTKLHEQQIGPNIKSVHEYFLKNKPLGEFTLVLGGAKKRSLIQDEKNLLSEMNSLLEEGLTNSAAAREVAQKTGLSRRKLYELIHKGNSKMQNILNTSE